MTNDTEEKPQAITDQSPQGRAVFWTVEFAAAKKKIEPWHSQGDKVIDRYRADNAGSGLTAVNIFTANVDTLRAMLFGKTPTTDVVRKFDDADDDVARVAAEILERTLDCDIEKEFAKSLEHVLSDRLLPGLGLARARYVAEFEDVEVPAQIDPMTGQELAPAYTDSVLEHEEVETVYVPWKDQLWSPARTFEEVRWWAFKTPMDRDQLRSMFGAIADLVPLNAPKSNSGKSKEDVSSADTPWSRADVWEIWNKTDETVEYYVEGFDRTLAVMPDPYELEGFWPFPRPLISHSTTSDFLPVPDFKISQDQYNLIDELTTRIDVLQKAVRAAGVYDKNATGVQRLLDATTGNQLFPVDNWAMFAEKGGMKGVVDWLPLEQIVGAMDKLRDVRNETMSLVQQVNGISDLMRGQSSGEAKTATEQAIKAKFGSVRLQRFQDEFAEFASELQNIRAQLMLKFYQPQTFIEHSNVARSRDARYMQPALELLKSGSIDYRIEIKPESISLTDYAALKQERTEIIQAIGGFLQVAGPMFQQFPPMAPQLMQILQWLVSGMRGASSIESTLDQAVETVQQMVQMQQQNGPPNPMQQEAAKVKLESDARIREIKAQTQADIIKKTAETGLDVRAQRALSMQQMDLMPDQRGVV